MAVTRRAPPTPTFDELVARVEVLERLLKVTPPVRPVRPPPPDPFPGRTP